MGRDKTPALSGVTSVVLDRGHTQTLTGKKGPRCAAWNSSRRHDSGTDTADAWGHLSQRTRMVRKSCLHAFKSKQRLEICLCYDFSSIYPRHSRILLSCFFFLYLYTLFCFMSIALNIGENVNFE